MNSRLVGLLAGLGLAPFVRTPKKAPLEIVPLEPPKPSGSRFLRSNNDLGFGFVPPPRNWTPPIVEREAQSKRDKRANWKQRMLKGAARARHGVAALLMLLLAGLAEAQDLGGRMFATQETLLQPGANRNVVFGARGIAKATVATLGARAARVFGRAQASALPDSGARLGSVTLGNLESYGSLELVGGVEVQAFGEFYVSGFYGIALQIEGGRPKALNESPQLYGGGIRRSLRFAENPGFVFAGACVNEARGSKALTGCASAQVPIGNLFGGKLSVIGDVYGPGEGSFSRVGVAFQL